MMPPMPAKRAGEHPDVRPDPLDIDARDGGEVAIVGDGAHRLAEVVRARKSATAGATTIGDGERHRLAGGDADEAEVVDGGLVDVELADARAGDEEDHVAHHQAEADGDQRQSRPGRGRTAAAAPRSEAPTASSAVAAIAPSVATTSSGRSTAFRRRPT